MKILLVNAFAPTPKGQKQFLDFRYIVQKAFINYSEVPDQEMEYIVRDFSSISDFLYEIQSSYVNQNAVQAFNAFDIIFVAGSGTTLPWSQQMEKILVLQRMCIKINKYLFACGCGMMGLVFLSASNFDRTVYFTNDELHPQKYFIEKSTGDIFVYHPDTKTWQPKSNAGLHNNKAAQEFQTLGKYILKAPIYRPFKNIEVYASKTNEIIVHIKSSHVNHYIFEGVKSQSFVATTSSKWDVHSFSFPSIERAFTILAESDRGPIIIEYGSYIIATLFDISLNYEATTQIIGNFIKTTVDKIKGGAKIQEQSKGVYIGKNKFKAKRNLKIELLYRSAPNSPEHSQQQSFKHSGFAVKRILINIYFINFISTHSFHQSPQLTKRIPLSKKLRDLKLEQTEQEQQNFQSPQSCMTRNEIIKFLHPSLDMEFSSFWIPGQQPKLSNTLKSKRK
ncbi:unnamed protein product (macronuclear) [Paramecium tetraurelia]|uniref:DJ-1/PfpI domain-containing protein n=1 Tax=Paramecium tetraurelia TaxID=5888 RepID=A0CDW6_PARTE|nr:uncharacterized protein GSPATT00007195001 [Paramecium tetraurelia]CAK68983.1 unnamed protein product [Paramecium tetraurelia]|eukprot:XP_001436380.1 hypothetical protein (macronuclear) [Paramecium tetraurelia strain d4-2]